MSSRDFGFLTLRNIQAYQPNGNPVPPNQILVTSGAGSGGFTNNLIISSICVSTVEVSTIYIKSEIASTINASTINASYISTTSLVASTINTNFLTVNSTTNLSTLNISGGISCSTIQNLSTLQFTNGFNVNTINSYLNFNGSVNIASTLNVSTLDADIISSFLINVQSTITLYDGPSTVELNAVGSTLYVNGHPILSGGSISSVSSLFWQPGPNGTIFNENVGTAGGNYNLVGIGTNGSALQATLDIRGTTQITSSLRVSSIINAQNINTTSLAIPSPTNQPFINYVQNIDSGTFPYPVLRFDSLKAGGTQNKTLTLSMTDGVAIWSSQWENYLMQDMQFICQDFYISSIADTIIESLSTINMTTPVVTVSNNMIVSSVSTNQLNMTSGVINSGNTILTLNTTNYTDIYTGGLRLYDPGDDGGATITLFNGKASIITNQTYDGMYLEASGDQPIRLCSTNNAKTYASFGPTTNTLYYNTLVSSAAFQVTYDQELQPFKGNNGNYLFTKPNSDGYINIGAWSTGTGGPIPLCLQVDSGGSPSGTPVGINTPSPAFTLDVNGNIHASGYLSTNTINMNSGSINSVGGISVNGPLLVSNSTDGNANLGLFNNKAFFTTNPTFDGCFLELNNSGPQFVVSGPGATPNYAIIGSTITQITQNKNNGYASLLVYNSGTTNTSAELLLQSARGSYGLYATQSEGGVGGLTASTFQIYSYYNTGGTPVLTIYPNGDTIIPGNLTVSGSAISNVACSTINNNSPNWSNFYGKYCFVTNDNANLTIGTPAADGTITVFRNTTTGNTTITVNGNTIASGKTLSFVYTATTGSATWFTL
jgi:hypothetical protein